VWLPIHLYGVAAFRAALDEKLDLAGAAYDRLAREPLLEVPWKPDLTVLPFCIRWSEQASRELLDRINESGRVVLSSTVVEGRFLLRLCILSHRTHRDRLEEALEIIVAASRQVVAGG
jgi:aromatic-L-amino-acid decarboxylase